MNINWLPKVNFSGSWKSPPPALVMFDNLEQLKYRLEHVKGQYELINKEISSINTFDKGSWSDLRVVIGALEQLNIYRDFIEGKVKDIEQPGWNKSEEVNGFTSRID